MPHTYDDSAAICVTCGSQYPPSVGTPEHCPICEDDRQYIPASGQQWTSLGALQGKHTNRFADLAPGITTIATDPKVGIGERAYLLWSPHGTILWDCIAFLDESMIREVTARGPVAGIAVSHPHFFTTMVAWSRALGGVPIWLHADHQPWVMRPDSAIQYWEGETFEPVPGMTLVRCGGHFPGSTVLAWPGAHAGEGALFTGDTITVVADPAWVTFMYSYPNDIPLDAATVRHIADAVGRRPVSIRAPLRRLDDDARRREGRGGALRRALHRAPGWTWVGAIRGVAPRERARNGRLLA